MEEEVMAYAMALFMSITGLTSPEWLKELNQRQAKLIKKALDYLAEHPSKLKKEGEIQAQALMKEGFELNEENRFQEAIEVTRKGLTLTQDAMCFSDLHNNIGYYQSRLGLYEESVESFFAALAADEGNAWAMSNLSYSLMMMGRLDAAEPLIREQLELNDDLGFAHRNVAIYHWKTDQAELAEEHFLKALEVESTTDLLELHYAQFLWEQERVEEAKVQLDVALEHNEPEALAWAKEVFH